MQITVFFPLTGNSTFHFKDMFLMFLICIKEHLHYIFFFANHFFNSWPTIFTWPNITHFEEKNSRPDF